MKPLPTTFAGMFSIAAITIMLNPNTTVKPNRAKLLNTPKIQAAILLDVSNSMDGLIEQAKSQLWNMVNVLAKVRCNEITPPIEIALYEYGRPENDSAQGYVKQLIAFTKDLDKLSLTLHAITTHGGDEYCGRVMYKALTELNWDTSSVSYKVIFIAGNESFLQGNLPFTKACEEAKKKGVIINTIYCGDKQKGIAENWNLGAECGNGSFTNIDQDAKEFSIPSPYDDSIMVLRDRLNGTYIVYGEKGLEYYRNMMSADTAAVSNVNDPSKVIEYVIARATPALYNNPQWDLIDAMEKDSTIIDTLNIKTLPDSLQNKTRIELKQIVKQRMQERKIIQREIDQLQLKEKSFVEEERVRRNIINPQTLQSEIERIIKDQVERLNMSITPDRKAF